MNLSMYETNMLCLPMPTNSYPVRHKRSIVTRPQVDKILSILRDSSDCEPIQESFIQWNDMDAEAQMTWTSEGNGDDFFEIGLAPNGCTIVVSIYRMDEDAIYLRLDPDTNVVIREVAL